MPTNLVPLNRIIVPQHSEEQAKAGKLIYVNPAAVTHITGTTRAEWEDWLADSHSRAGGTLLHMNVTTHHSDALTIRVFHPLEEVAERMNGTKSNEPAEA